MIHNNPFISITFSKVWETHFTSPKQLKTFNFIKELKFFKHPLLPFYTNVGRNLTKGVSYSLNQHQTANDYKNKAFLIYDVPQYFDIQTNTPSKHLRVKKIKQYPGFLINQKNYIDFNDYLKKTFSKSSVQKFNRYKRRLENCFNIKEKMWIGNIEKAEYDGLFNHFKVLLTKRFEDKQITNNNLNPEEWAFYKEVAFPMILEKKAALHVLYNNETPISIRLLYFSDTIIFDAITVFDIDYSKFHIGKVSIMKMLEWSFKSDYTIFDFSKGYFDYKESWSDLKYDFEYHVYYDAKSLKSIITANFISSFFKLKQYLRDKETNKKLHQITFLLKKEKSNTSEIDLAIIDEKTISYTENMLIKINGEDVNYAFLKKHAYDFLFLTSEHVDDLKLFKINGINTNTHYLIKGKNNQVVLSSINS
ncbi:acetyltransferase (GNAT) family protein [Mariniflexile fucanivorans]|uniref:Acetyltransferase (GNAT) family protein n=1 Tax=Mariniflexile fucanivorans TaxID=264023 RepID=A0A4R1RGF4_9FLAO|nr:GNAT family N-acetyltransferase [Mariniflexile fucanivorans]TCL65026.1 acetyltransferase (GNAT) family protein [Mariniflexile fucanivorans]